MKFYKAGTRAKPLGAESEISGLPVKLTDAAAQIMRVSTLPCSSGSAQRHCRPVIA